MIDWEVTATTMYCDAVADEVTIILNSDGTVRCIGYEKYSNPDKNNINHLKSKGKQFERTLQCQDLGCSLITGYKEKIFSE